MDVIIDKTKFLEDLDLHMAQIGRPIGKSPIMGYKELNLHQLFCEVIAFGGFEEVVKKVGTWARMWKRLDNFDPSVTDASFRLRKNYERCLLDYEIRRFPDHRISSAESLTEIQNRLNTDQKVNISRKRNSKSPRKIAHSRKDSLTEDLQSSSLNPHNTPIVVDDFVVESFGTLIPHPAYVSAKCVYPLGYKSCRNFWSMRLPNQLTRYTSQIVQSGITDENDTPLPLFIVTTDDDPLTIIKGESPSKVWKIVFKRVFGDSKYYDNESNGLMSTRLRVKKDVVSGNGQFGLTNPVIVSTLKELPNSTESFKLLNQAKKKKRKSKALSSDEDSDDSRKTKQRSGDNESNDESFGSGDDSSMSRSSSYSSLISNLELNDDDDFELDFASQTISSFKFNLNCSSQSYNFEQPERFSFHSEIK